jgi:hypothetical protein
MYKAMRHFLPILAVAGLSSMVAKPTPAFAADDRSTNDLGSQTSQQYRRVYRGGVTAKSFEDRGTTPNPMLYVLTNDPASGAPGFGLADPANGSFVPIGDASALPPDLGHALLPTAGASLLSLGFSGNLYSIEPRTGKARLRGTTGLGDCTTPASPCGSNSANTIAYFDGKYYALDFSQNLYSLDPGTGATKLIGPTGIPMVNFVPGAIDPGSGKLNLYFESVFSFRGNLYANFDESQLDLTTGELTAVVHAALYEINPRTGHTRVIGPTDQGLLTIVTVNGTVYAFDAPNDRFLTLDVTSGQTQPAHAFSPAGGLVCGAAPARPSPSPDQE